MILHKLDQKCTWLIICNSFGPVPLTLFISSPVVEISSGVEKSQCYNDTGGAAEKPLWLLHKTGSDFGFVPECHTLIGSSQQRDVRTIASIYAGQERVDEELHVLPLNYHAPTASAHNGPWCNLGTHSETRQKSKGCLQDEAPRGAKHTMWTMQCKLEDVRDDSSIYTCFI